MKEKKEEKNDFNLIPIHFKNEMKNKSQKMSAKFEINLLF